MTRPTYFGSPNPPSLTVTPRMTLDFRLWAFVLSFIVGSTKGE